jgi:transcriptional/translational regulatory protein YebC/TACO1
MYDLKGKFIIPSENVDEEALLMAAIDNDVSDVELVEGFEALGSMGLADGAKMSLTYVTKAPVECSDEDFEKNMAIIDALEELDDVDSVEHNMSN